MAIQDEVENNDPTVTVGLAVSSSKSSKYAVQWAVKNFCTNGMARFVLIHVLQRVTTVPTPMGNYIPIDKVRADIASAYEKEVECKARTMLLFYKNMCDEKAKAEVLVVKGEDVAETISNVVSMYEIHKLVVGDSSQGNFIRKSKGTRTSSQICRSVPSFCAVYVVSKGGLSAVYSPGFEGHKSSELFLSSDSSKTEIHSDDKPSLSDATPSRSFRSNLTWENLESLSSADHDRPRSLHEYLTESTSASVGDNNSNSPWASGQTPRPSNMLISDKAPVTNSPLQELMLSEDMDDVNSELEKLRLELRHIKGACKLVQDESINASQHVTDLAAKRAEEEARLSEVYSRINRVNEQAHQEKEQRNALEAQCRHVRDLARKEALQKQILQLRTSKEADKMQRLENLLELDGMSYSTFTWEDIESATSSFSEAFKIGSGSNGTVYKGNLRQTSVAIKVLTSDDSHRIKHFKQELEVLGKIRHPHLLLLIGACLDRPCLVYEYMENGSLEDRLQLKGGTAPLPWYQRLRIAWEIALALVYLHSSKPKPIIHRDLKPANILLDSNFTSKIGDVGLSTLLPLGDALSTTRTIFKDTDLVGTLFYMDPEYQRTGQVSTKSDTYALGMVLLQLLTGKPPVGLADLVEQAVENGHLVDILDKSAGKWPAQEAHELAQLGLSCLEMRSKHRPDLKCKVLVELERLKKIASAVSDPVRPVISGPPSHFICPILKRIMQDPCIASDGYSYDRVAIEMWLCENDMSPITKSRLPNKDLVPNHALLCAITSWKAEARD
uniref:RING-type E3 ubiquitin transferase n=1 Tax=Oryza meridionalis TaxID=40149 RepID=A0A0E0EGP8_9ORYZ